MSQWRSHRCGSWHRCHPCGGFHAVWRIALAAENSAAGSAFRGWECGHAAPWWCNRACRPLRPGWLLVKGKSSWTSCWWRSGSGFYLRDLMPVAWDGLVSRAVEAPGCARVSTVFRMFRHWQLGHELWRDPAVSMATRAEPRRSDRGRAQRAMAEWLQFVVDYPDLHIPAPCALCGSLTRHLCVGCLVSFCPTCRLDRADPLCCAEAMASGDMRLEMPALRFGENTGRIIQHLVRQNLPLVQRGP